MAILPRSLQKHNVPTMYLQKKSLNWVKEHKYLGISICNNFRDDRDVKRQMRAIYYRGNSLINKFRHCSVEVKTQLFKSFCSNMYCSPLWSCYSKEVYRKLKVAYNNIFRNFMSVNRMQSTSQLQNFYGIDSFNVLIRKNIVNFRNRLLSSKNGLIQACFTSDFHIYRSLINKKWLELAFKF